MRVTTWGRRMIRPPQCPREPEPKFAVTSSCCYYYDDVCVCDTICVCVCCSWQALHAMNQVSDWTLFSKCHYTMGARFVYTVFVSASYNDLVRQHQWRVERYLPIYLSFTIHNYMSIAIMYVASHISFERYGGSPIHVALSQDWPLCHLTHSS